jgi:hypothetical protein
MRQQVPIIFRTRLEGAINDINIDEGQMLEGDHLHPTFVDSLTSMMEEAQENAIALYKSIIPSDDALSALITPAPSIAAVAPPPLQDRDRAALTISGFIGQDSFWSKSPQRPATVGRYAASNQEISSVTTPSCTKPSEHPQYSGYDPKATSFYDIQDADAPYGNQSQGMTLDEATVDKAFDSCCIGDSLWYTVQTDPGPIFSKSGTEDDNTTLTGTNNSFGWEGMG